MAMKGLMIAGLASGSGKTTVTLGLLRALKRQGISVSAGKTGPDYIDAGFLTAASGRSAVNLDQFAMSKQLLTHLANDRHSDLLVIEGVMGLFDGAKGDIGSSVALAEVLNLPIILVLDVRHTAQTAAMITAGVVSLLPAGRIAGVILNHVASPRHLKLISDVLALQKITLFGALPSKESIQMPSRHLGLIQAVDFDQLGLEMIIDEAADLISDHCDLAKICDTARSMATPSNKYHALPRPSFPTPAEIIAVANDAAFGFSYHHMLASWQQQGAEIRPFSPRNNEGPDSDAHFVFLPGGYPELYLPTLSSADQFFTGLKAAAESKIPIYGECGGFMTLGTGITDALGVRFEMAGLLSLETSFAEQKRHLGYRKFTAIDNFFWDGPFLGHEFHYTSTISSTGTPLFTVNDADNKALGSTGLRKGSVAGSFLHIIAAA